MDKNGIVTIVSNKGSAAGRTAAQEMLTPTALPSPWSFSQLVDGIMGKITSACFIVLTFTRKAIFTDDASAKSNIGDVLPGVDYIEVTPDAGQESRSLTWATPVVNNRVNLNPEAAAALVALAGAPVAPTKPRKTASALAQELLALVDAENNPVFRTVVIDQSSKAIRCYPNDFTADILDAVETAGGNTAVLEVEGDSDPDDPDVVKLPFEGGAV
jgi:hypothetical protein